MLKELVIRNRSCRGFDSKRPVTHEELVALVDVVRYAGAGMNVQPYKYRLVSDPAEAASVNKLTRLAMHLKELGLPYPGQEPPAYIVVCKDRSIIENDNAFIIDLGIIGQTITLAATEMGLAGCMIGNFQKNELTKVLGLSDQYSIQLVIAIGKSVEDIQIVEIDEGDDSNYYRDSEGTHYVPKRKLENVIIK